MPKILYLNKEGVEVPSTTTIIGKYKDYGGLMYYAWSEGKAGRGLNESRDRAGDVGSMLHGMIECYLNSKPYEESLPKFTLGVDVMKACELFGTFKQWWEANRMDVIATETSLVSEEY